MFTSHLRVRGSQTERTCGRWLRPRHVTVCGAWLTQPARHAASVWSRTIMKNQPSVGAAADAILSYVQRAFLPGLTTSSTGRWIKATPRLFLSLNGEENGRWLFVLWLFMGLSNRHRGSIVTGPFDWQVSPPVHAASCLSGNRTETAGRGGFGVFSDTLAVPSNYYYF